MEGSLKVFNLNVVLRFSRKGGLSFLEVKRRAEEKQSPLSASVAAGVTEGGGRGH